MPLSFRERRKILKDANYLDLTPYHIFKSETDDKGLVTVLVPKFRNKLLAKLILPRLKSSHFKIKLDEIGSLAWQHIDGSKNVAMLSSELVDILGDKIQPVNERLPKFLTSLYLEGYISFNEIKKEGE
ncbi:MAG: PqqD family protein [Bacteroidota bacterium]|nr:PqqD family protein [Bacteroidota bacterium]MDP4193326.1 PqqD family protein [Bacteroidota bacterium]MDP4194611.1 PqqD family protein [Bacteroidota bacterium]